MFSHMAKFKRACLELENLGQPLTQHEKCQRLIASLILLTDFNTTIETYETAHSRLEDANFDALVQLLTGRAKTLHNKAFKDTASTAGFVALTKSNDIDALVASKVKELFADQVAAAYAAGARSVNPNLASISAAGGGKQPPRNKKVHSPYCGTHGPNSSHNGCDCRRPSEWHLNFIVTHGRQPTIRDQGAPQTFTHAKQTA